MRAMLGGALERYGFATAACVVLALLVVIFAGWTFHVFGARSQPSLERGSRLPLEGEDQ